MSYGHRVQAAQVRHFIENSPTLGALKGYWTPATVDNAIAYLTRDGRLEYRKKAEPAPVVAQPPETLGTCEDGKPQLSLHTTTDYDLRNATAPQVRDYLSRKRVADGLIYTEHHGGFAGKF
jgi:hypothetical protein